MSQQTCCIIISSYSIRLYSKKADDRLYVIHSMLMLYRNYYVCMCVYNTAYSFLIYLYFPLIRNLYICLFFNLCVFCDGWKMVQMFPADTETRKNWIKRSSTDWWRVGISLQLVNFRPVYRIAKKKRKRFSLLLQWWLWNAKKRLLYIPTRPNYIVYICGLIESSHIFL